MAQGIEINKTLSSQSLQVKTALSDMLGLIQNFLTFPICTAEKNTVIVPDPNPLGKCMDNLTESIALIAKIEDMLRGEILNKIHREEK